MEVLALTRGDGQRGRRRCELLTHRAHEQARTPSSGQAVPPTQDPGPTPPHPTDTPPPQGTKGSTAIPSGPEWPAEAPVSPAESSSQGSGFRRYPPYPATSPKSPDSDGEPPWGQPLPQALKHLDNCSGAVHVTDRSPMWRAQDRGGQAASSSGARGGGCPPFMTHSRLCGLLHYV